MIRRNNLGARRGMLATALAGAAVLASAGTFAALVPPAAAASHDIAILDATFEPATLTVVVGEPVTWTNETAETHTVTLDDGSVDSGPIGPGEAFGHVFETPGTFRYHCALHPQVVATIVVEAAPVTPAPGGSPTPVPPPGTLPPNFSPFPSIGPTPTPTAAPTAASTPAGDGGVGGDAGAGPVAIAALGVLAGLGAILLVARRRGRRSS